MSIAPPPAPFAGAAAIQADIAEIERESQGLLCVAARDLQTGDTIRYNADRRVKSASVIKLPILIAVALAVEEGILSWDEPLTLVDEEKVDGSGILTDMTTGLVLCLRDVCTLMIVLSDNTATNMVIERVGVDAVNARMRALGLRKTALFRKAYDADTPESREFGLGAASADEMLDLLTRLARGSIGPVGVCSGILRVLGRQQFLDCIPRLLPEEWPYAGKTGAITGVRNDVGIVTAPDGRRFALALFAQQLSDLRWTPDNAGKLALARVAERLLIGARAPRARNGERTEHRDRRESRRN